MIWILNFLLPLSTPDLHRLCDEFKSSELPRVSAQQILDADVEITKSYEIQIEELCE
jgi:hypothetical protein